jgi:hypothetical protein
VRPSTAGAAGELYMLVATPASEAGNGGLDHTLAGRDAQARACAFVSLDNDDG